MCLCGAGCMKWEVGCWWDAGREAVRRIRTVARECARTWFRVGKFSGDTQPRRKCWPTATVACKVWSRKTPSGRLGAASPTTPPSVPRAVFLLLRSRGVLVRGWIGPPGRLDGP